MKFIFKVGARLGLGVISIFFNNRVSARYVGCNNFAILLMSIASSNAVAGSCDSASKITADIWNKYDSVIKTAGMVAGPETQAAVAAAKVAEQMIGYWNSVNDNGWGRLGPRRLEFGKSLTGKLIGTGERLFVSEQPLERDSVDLTIQKTDGKARAEVTVCVQSRDDRHKIWEFEIESGKENVGHTWRRKVSGVKGKLLSIHLDAKSLTNTVGYTLSAKFAD